MATPKYFYTKIYGLGNVEFTNFWPFFEIFVFSQKLPSVIWIFGFNENNGFVEAPMHKWIWPNFLLNMFWPSECQRPSPVFWKISAFLEYYTPKSEDLISIKNAGYGIEKLPCFTGSAQIS